MADDIHARDPRIEIDRWWLGEHFFATVDGRDVVDLIGNVKWNTYDAAMEAAEDYMKRLDARADKPK